MHPSRGGIGVSALLDFLVIFQHDRHTKGLLKNNFPTPKLTLHVSSRECAFEGRKQASNVSFFCFLAAWVDGDGDLDFYGL